MSISEPFIRRPVATTLLTCGLLLAGLAGYNQLPVSALPQVDYPTIVVSTLLPGASAETMASAVTTPLERQFGQIPALSQMTSVSSLGTSQITLQFELTRDIDAAEQDVQAAINATSNLLPATLPAPPTYSKSNPADTPVLTLAITSDSLPLDQVSDQADSILAQKISQVSGVGLVTINGGQKPAVRVQIDPAALAGANLTLEDVRTALVAANVNQPKGNLDGPRLDYALQTDDQLSAAASFEPLVLAYANGAPIRLRDVGSAIDGVENAQLAGWAGEKRAIILNVQRQPGANIIQVADRVKALLPQLTPTLAQGLTISILSDRTETVRASVEDVQFTLVLTVLLVIAVNFVFLRSVRATIIPGIAVPLSLVGTFGVMYLTGYSLNNLSLMALTIATGFVVDDAIVMIENISRFIEAGDTPFNAALKGAKQIGFTIVSLTVSLVAVLIPLLFMGGLIGRLFREFAVTLAIAIGVSALLSLTLTAMMSAHLLKGRDSRPQARFHQASERFFDGMIRVYRKGLDWVFDHQALMLGLTAVTLALTVLLASLIPKGFFPLQDTGLILGITQAAPDASFPRMMDLQQRLSAVVREDPDVATVSSFIGADGTNPTTTSGRLSITLKPHKEREASASEIIARLQPKLAQVSGIQAFLQSVQDLQISSRQSRTQFQYTLEDANPAELAEWAPRILEKLQSLPQLRDVTSDQQEGGLQLKLTIDRDTAARLSLPTQVVDDTLYDAFGQRQVSTIFTQLNQYRVILEVNPELQRDPSTLDLLHVRAPTGDVVPLSAIVQPRIEPAALTISHQDQFPSVTLSFDTKRGVALGQAVDAIRAAETELGLPPGIRASFEGTAQSFSESLASEPLLLLAALLTVYIVLGVLYESYIHPITILSTLPSAGVGALLALMLFRIEFSIIALIGIVLLIGIVKKNAIMMIDFALEAEREQQLSPREAIRQAALLRFRPIMMTTLAALLGGLPLALGQGTGSELRQPLGISIVGGLLLSQLLTLFTTPVIYLSMERLGRFLAPHKHPSQLPEAP
ncbi:multidrug efflux RND transporter permease subunit [Stigmatella aurantiaca]|uniref:Acriflavin resistance family protein n=1 Tax=Stigmatella aurantiaca (strain DW4/3-1) TaxID=378806 RepID=Q08VD7_STIAD|nr:multidrug efflux RND transporter permease subunit [Stigmatella aurantiaca]ADO70955.1 Acriflavin resistance family protein [Stigmatella aurantiaca DW4/3-1]EAU64431.1 acriflavin resistance protein [Stigmatella aurantiaca DW4/3-1]